MGKAAKRKPKPNGPDRIRTILASFERTAWKGGKAAIHADQVHQVVAALGDAAPAWFREIPGLNYGHHGFVNFEQAKQIVTLLDEAAQAAQPADAAGGSLAEREAGKGVVAAPDQSVASEALAALAGWLESQVALHQRQLKDALTHRATSREDCRRNDRAAAYAAATIKLAGVLLDAMTWLTPDGFRLLLPANCPSCGGHARAVIVAKVIDADLEAEDGEETCPACRRTFQAQLVHYVSTSEAGDP